MPKRKVLYICHNHPSVRPGGAEAYALELYQAMRASDEFEPIFLAKGGPPMSPVGQPHSGTLFGFVDSDPNQYLFYTEGTDFDWFYGTLRKKEVYTRCFHEFLIAYRPDIVHFQHTMLLGYDLIRQVKNTLPDAAIVYTLHEYLPICHNHGQMVRTQNHELCQEASPRCCHECFPEISPQAFFLRKRFIQSHFSSVDLFLSPSRFLLERYVEWGIPREQIRYEDNGRRPVQPLEDSEERRPRNRLGFFGRLTQYKGVEVLLQAMKILVEDEPTARSMPFSEQSCLPAPWSDIRGRPLSQNGSVHLWLHGANLELEAGTFQNQVRALLEATRQNVTLAGRYSPAELPRLMANIDWVILPSIWWENAPLVIQEAFQYGRPVICSDIGGMLEKVTHGVNGLHFAVGDALSLAQSIRYAVNTPGLWERLRSGIPQVYKMEDHVSALSEIYCVLLDRKVSKG
jgi:glycosyltransferase involved in cell wall biosynthesis